MIYKSTPRHLSNEEISKLETVKENEQLSTEEKMRRVKEAKGGTWYNNWREENKHLHPNICRYI